MFHRLRSLPLHMGGTASSQGPLGHPETLFTGYAFPVGLGWDRSDYCQVQLLVELGVSAARLPPCASHSCITRFWTLGKCSFSSSSDACMLPKFSLGFNS